MEITFEYNFTTSVNLPTGLTVPLLVSSGQREAVAAAVQSDGGMEAVQLRVAEKLVEQFGNLAKQGTTLILPENFGDISSLIATAMSIVKKTK